MIDKDFELVADTALTIPKNYFNRYAALFLQYNSQRLAWEAVENELWRQTGGHRFLSLQSFKDEMTNYHAGRGAKEVRLKLECRP